MREAHDYVCAVKAHDRHRRATIEKKTADTNSHCLDRYPHRYALRLYLAQTQMTRPYNASLSLFVPHQIATLIFGRNKQKH